MPPRLLRGLTAGRSCRADREAGPSDQERFAERDQREHCLRDRAPAPCPEPRAAPDEPAQEGNQHRREPSGYLVLRLLCAVGTAAPDEQAIVELSAPRPEGEDRRQRQPALRPPHAGHVARALWAPVSSTAPPRVVSDRCPTPLYFTSTGRPIIRAVLALLIGFALDQQVPVQAAFSRAELKERIGDTSTPARIAVDQPSAGAGIP